MLSPTVIITRSKVCEVRDTTVGVTAEAQGLAHCPTCLRGQMIFLQEADEGTFSTPGLWHEWKWVGLFLEWLREMEFKG